MQQDTMGTLEWALLIVLSLLWGGSFFFAKVALDVVPPFTLVLCRVTLASAALFFFTKVTGGKIPWTNSAWAAFASMGILNNLIPFALIFYGQTQIGASLASILNATTPVFTVIVAHFLTSNERATPSKVAGAALGVAGVVLLIGFDALKGQSLAVLGMMGCLGAALSYAFAAIYGRRFQRMKVEPVTVAFGQVTATMVMVAPAALVIDTPWLLATPGTGALLSIFALGLLSTALAYVIFFFLLARSGATNITLVTFLIPISGIFLGIVVLGEHLFWNHIAGLIVITLGLAAIDGRFWKWTRQKTHRFPPN
ncbi:MAG: ABC transporter permease [Hyphococcus sp.]|nr:MAG: ABC transporter permease [Marinicaulis sp.]